MSLEVKKFFQMSHLLTLSCINLCLIIQFHLSSSLENSHVESAENFARKYDHGNLFPIYTRQISQKLGQDYWGGHHAGGSKEFEKEKNFKYKGEKVIHQLFYQFYSARLSKLMLVEIRSQILDQSSS